MVNMEMVMVEEYLLMVVGGVVVVVVGSGCNKFSICENMYCISSLSPNTIVWL